MQKAHQRGVLLRSQPVVNEVLERGEELYDALLDLLPDPVLVGEEEDQVLIHADVCGIDGSVDLRRMQDPMIVDLVDRLFKISPRRQTEFQLFLGTLQTSGAWRER